MRWIGGATEVSHAAWLGTATGDTAYARSNTSDDATPFSLTGGFLFAEDFEAFLRVQDLDNEVDATMAAVGLNYYVNGHATKWQFNVEQYDDDNIDGTVIEAGLAIGYSDRY